MCRRDRNRLVPHDLLQTIGGELGEAELEAVGDGRPPGTIALELVDDRPWMPIDAPGDYLVHPVRLVRLRIPGQRVDHPPAHRRCGLIAARHERAVAYVQAEEVARGVACAKKV